MDFEAAGLLDGLQGRERQARLRLLEHLAAEGVELAEMRAAVDEERLALLPVDRVLGARYSAREIARRTGLPADLLIRWRRLQGLPEPAIDQRAFDDEDIAAARATKLFLNAGLTERAIAQITRVLGESMARLAATITATFADTFLEPGDSEDQVALRFAALAERLTPALSPVLAATFRAHLRESVRRGMLREAEREAGQLADEQEIAVCFADIVGFTRLGGELDVHELGLVAGGLARLANEATTGPVRLVKTIGDAAMFVSREIPPLVAAALSLVEAVERADLPALRAGIAFGPAVLSAGDFYGHSVNLASRVTGIARPGSVLCTAEVRDAARDQFDWSFAGRHRLKGIPEPLPLYRARRPTPERAPARKPPADRRRTRASR